MTTKPKQLSIVIDWSDMDLFGHVNNVMYFRYVQAARVYFCEEIGLDSTIKSSHGFMVAASACNFKKPLNYPGKAVVIIDVLKTGNSSFTLTYSIMNSVGETCAEAQDTLVYYDHLNARSVALTEELRANLSVWNER